MKKIILILTLSICCFTVNAQTKLPFTGTRYFNLEDGSCCNESITIYKNGTCVIKGYQAPEFGTTVAIRYKGNFLPVIWFYKKGKKDYGYEFGSVYVSQLNKFGKIVKGRHGVPSEPYVCELTDSMY